MHPGRFPVAVDVQLSLAPEYRSAYLVARATAEECLRAIARD